MNRIDRSRSRSLVALAVVAAVALAAPGGAEASEPYTFTLILEGTIGGPLQEGQGSDAGLDNSGFQLGFSVIGAGEVHIGGRVGSIDFDQGLGGATDVTLEYINIGGDYRFHEGFYDSGIYFGLGQYEIEGRDSLGMVTTETSIGLALGLTGEFELAKNVGLMLEITSHITDLAAAELFVTAHAGLAIHF